MIFTALRQKVAQLGPWLRCWEIYPILFVAAFLRLFQLNNTIFDYDQISYFWMARYAATHALIPATAGESSLSYMHPPATIDLLMIPAALTPDPLWGAGWTAILAIAAVLLTYVLVRRYYGRIAATIAAFLYATLFQAIFYSRFIWNPNFLAVFVLLFVMALFRGTVDRRPGWLLWALLWLGVAIQLHESGTMLIFPLIVALVLAPGTIRWRDLLLGLLAPFIFCLPYLVWIFTSHFHDVQQLINDTLHPERLSHYNKSIFDGQAWSFYKSLLSPYVLSSHNPLLSNKVALVPLIAHGLAQMNTALIPLVVISMATAFVSAIWTGNALVRSWKALRSVPEGGSTTDVRAAEPNTMRRWWQHFRASPPALRLDGLAHLATHSNFTTYASFIYIIHPLLAFFSPWSLHSGGDPAGQSDRMAETRQGHYPAIHTAHVQGATEDGYCNFWCVLHSAAL